MSPSKRRIVGANIRSIYTISKENKTFLLITNDVIAEASPGSAADNSAEQITEGKLRILISVLL